VVVAPADAAAEPVDGAAVAPAVQTIPYTQQELANITRLVQESVGFNVLRGDSVNVINVPFTKVEVESLPEQGFFEKQWVWDVAKQVLGALVVLFMIFGILKPVMKNLAIRPAEERIVSEDGEDLEDDQLSLSGQEEKKMLDLKASYEESLQHAQTLATQEPKRVVQVVKNWIEE